VAATVKMDPQAPDRGGVFDANSLVERFVLVLEEQKRVVGCPVLLREPGLQVGEGEPSMR
jgi:hypothetical protein